jgi:hypothetical protein
VAIGSGLWETVSMSEKRTKADKAQRQADQLDKKARHPAGKKKKKKTPARTSAKPLPDRERSWVTNQV